MTGKIKSESKIGSVHEIVIEKMAHEGQGIGKINGKTVFIENAIMGEKCRIEIVKSKSYAIGKVIEILEPSPYRVIPACTNARECGGCSLYICPMKGSFV